MKNVSDFVVMANNLSACAPAMRYLATLEPSAPVEQVWEKLHCDNREWINWLIDRTLYLGYTASVAMKPALFNNVLILLDAFDAERSMLRSRIHKQYQERLIAATTVSQYWSIYDSEFLPDYLRHAYAIWSTHYVPQMQPTIVEWLHALEIYR